MRPKPSQYHGRKLSAHARENRGPSADRDQRVLGASNGPWKCSYHSKRRRQSNSRQVIAFSRSRTKRTCDLQKPSQLS
ncbi:hypothetical protein PsYK624_074030 [Phanerochaete sordida]|uniref:Uncharacterized protein n=1 Tax=Phanerochaete sordida TaxID=48140 RepID=A0A9P3LE48_9APHY|nr:hypothetical protein PsYK624_074030 [Phanerochaete sordida]